MVQVLQHCSGGNSYLPISHHTPYFQGSRDNMSAVLVTFPAAPEVNEEARLKDEEV